MKMILLWVALLMYATSYCQEKTVKRSTQKVNLYMVDESDIIFLTDSSGKEIHARLEVIKIDSMLFEDHLVLLLYGKNALISFCDLYIAYDTMTEGYLYLQPKKD